MLILHLEKWNFRNLCQISTIFFILLTFGTLFGRIFAFAKTGLSAVPRLTRSIPGGWSPNPSALQAKSF
jgi:hypothetical protein